MAFRSVLAIGLFTLLTACGGRFETSFNAPVPPEESLNWRLADVQVEVPTSLSVSDANSLAPNADIVWHGDPAGDRRAQVAAILEDGIRRGGQALEGDRPVIITATLREFHAVTPRAVSRAPSAVHNISYAAQVFDARTLEVLMEPQELSADLEALVGASAIVAASQGQTQKVRITDHLAQVTAAWLSIGPDNRRQFVTLGR